MENFDAWLMLAQEKAAPGIVPPWVMLVLLVGVFYLLIIRPGRQQQKAHQTLLSQLKKHDRVVTVSGIKGLVTNVGPEFVTLKIDEKNNIEIEVTLGSIAKVLTEQSEQG